MKEKLSIMLSVIVLLGIPVTGQQKINPAEEHKNGQIEAMNRTLSLYGESPGAVEMNAAMGDGLAILKSVEFETGTIGVELLGENNPGRSFIGIAFNIRDNETYEAIYFRPFNFVADAQLNRDHMVQYICHPDYTWNRLRTERTGEFENEIPSPPDPDNWFRALIKVSADRVQVYLEGREDPVLEVERLAGTGSQMIGFWTGNGSSGRFRNLTLTAD